jgi:hypothetical protein
LKHIRIFEDFDLDKFMEDPESQFHDDSDPNIIEGDWVTSYRGPAKFLSLSNGMAKVQLINGPGSVVSVPYDALTKINKEEALKMSRNMINAKEELDRMNSEMDSILKASIGEDEETGGEIFIGNDEKTVSYLEDFLVDLIDLKNKDTYAPYYTEYGKFTSQLASLCYLLLDHIGRNIDSSNNSSETGRLKNLKNKVEVIQDKFFEISE